MSRVFRKETLLYFVFGAAVAAGLVFVEYNMSHYCVDYDAKTEICKKLIYR